MRSFVNSIPVRRAEYLHGHFWSTSLSDATTSAKGANGAHRNHMGDCVPIFVLVASTLRRRSVYGAELPRLVVAVTFIKQKRNRVAQDVSSDWLKVEQRKAPRSKQDAIWLAIGQHRGQGNNDDRGLGRTKKLALTHIRPRKQTACCQKRPHEKVSFRELEPKI